MSRSQIPQSDIHYCFQTLDPTVEFLIFLLYLFSNLEPCNFGPDLGIFAHSGNFLKQGVSSSGNRTSMTNAKVIAGDTKCLIRIQYPVASKS